MTHENKEDNTTGTNNCISCGAGIAPVESTGDESFYQDRGPHKSSDLDTDPFMQIEHTKLTRDLVNQVRAEHDIPPDYKAYLVTDCSLKDRVWQSLPTDSPYTHNFTKLRTRYGKYEFYSCDGLFKHTDDSYVSIIMTQNNSYVIIFSRDITTYLNSLAEDKIHVTPGTYRVIRTTMGNVLSRVNVPDHDPPILNDDLQSTLLTEINNFKEHEHTYLNNGFDYKRGILLYGKPGNGKTHFIRHLLTHLEDSFNVLIDCRDGDQLDFLQCQILDDERLYDYYKVIVLEDIDGLENFHRSRLLNILDGVSPTYRTIFIATTNYPTNIDEGLLGRPSRFDTIHHIDEPNEHVRSLLLKKYFPGLSSNDVAEATKRTEGYRGAYFKELYLLTQLHGFDVFQAIDELNKRFRDFNDFQQQLNNNSMNYMG